MENRQKADHFNLPPMTQILRILKGDSPGFSPIRHKQHSPLLKHPSLITQHLLRLFVKVLSKETPLHGQVTLFQTHQVLINITKYCEVIHVKNGLISK